MRNEYFIELKECFIKHPDLKDDYLDLYELITTINKSIDLQEQITEINNKITELNDRKSNKEEK